MYRSSSKLITDTMISKWIVHFFLLSSFFPSIHSTDFLPPSSAKLSTIWNGELDRFGYLQLPTQILSQNISNSTEMPSICFGFTFTDPGYNLVISASINCSRDDYPKLVLWSANRYTPVSKHATLQFNSLGDLILREVDGTTVWSTNTSGKAVVGMRITATGNLLLYNVNNTIAWSSFNDDQSTSNIWMPGRKLELGQRITANEGMFYLSITDQGLDAFIHSNPPQRYREYSKYSSIEFRTGSLSFNDGETGSPISVNYISDGRNAFQYMRLENDGHLRVYYRQWFLTENYVRSDEIEVDDIFTIDYSDCSYPTVCGSYGICSSDEQCSCPLERGGDSSYFKPLNYKNLSLGCKEMTTLSCNSSEIHLIEIDVNVTYIGFVEFTMENTDVDDCKQACMNNCSCKAALFRSYPNSPGDSGDCFLPSQLFSFMTHTEFQSYYSNLFLKVQNVSQPFLARNQDENNVKRYATILGIIFGITFSVVLVGVFVYVIRNKIRKKEVAKENQLLDEVDDASEMPKRFSYEELKSATGNFHKKIGRGGFGFVYKGILDNKTVAVKCLDLSQGQSQGTKQFLAEVKTIGNIHHVNLVKLVGFCAEKSHSLLAYEYMCNGSLDEWIFNEYFMLDWCTRKKIILDVAKGLSYLHEDCRKGIIHLDIKPQNILLDDNFNAKLSDFGLARIIENEESQILTMMRGTRGYLAPEWFLNRKITEKVDVYSFGVVVLEIVCGRRNLDNTQPEESECLLHVIKRKAEEDALNDLLEKRYENMQQHKEEAVKMIRIAIWCLQGDYTSRPSMSTVVKVLEGGTDMENISDYSFLTLAPMVLLKQSTASASAPLVPSILSGPR